MYPCQTPFTVPNHPQTDPSRRHFATRTPLLTPYSLNYWWADDFDDTASTPYNAQQMLLIEVFYGGINDNIVGDRWTNVNMGTPTLKAQANARNQPITNNVIGVTNNASTTQTNPARLPTAIH